MRTRACNFAIVRSLTYFVFVAVERKRGGDNSTSHGICTYHAYSFRCEFVVYLLLAANFIFVSFFLLGSISLGDLSLIIVVYIRSLILLCVIPNVPRILLVGDNAFSIFCRSPLSSSHCECRREQERNSPRCNYNILWHFKFALH
jgi:hypothetical protein